MPKIDTPITANSETLTKTLQVGLPVVLVLYNGNLPAYFEDTLKRIAKAEAERLLLVKIDVKDNPSLGIKFDLSAGTPLLVAYKNGEEIARRHQATPGTLENYTAYLLGRSSQIDNQPAPPKTTAKPLTVTDATFVQEVLSSDKPVLVDFWAEWCGPCHMIAPTLEKMAGEFAGKVTIAKLDVDRNQQTAGQYRIQSIPHLLLFKNGKVVDRIVGAQPEPVLRQFIQKHLS